MEYLGLETEKTATMDKNRYDVTDSREAATFLIRSSRGSHEFDSASIVAVAKSTALVQHLQNTHLFTPEGCILANYYQ